MFHLLEEIIHILFHLKYTPPVCEKENKIQKYPELLLNNQPIDDKIKHIEPFVTEIGGYQEKVYNFIVEKIGKR